MAAGGFVGVGVCTGGVGRMSGSVAVASGVAGAAVTVARGAVGAAIVGTGVAGETGTGNRVAVAGNWAGVIAVPVGGGRDPV